MSERLIKKINEVLMKEGPRGKTRLALAAGKSEQMIDRYRKRICKPPIDVAREIALACGSSETEASELALECLPEGQRTA